MTEIIVGRFNFDGQNFSDVSYGGIEIKSTTGLLFTLLRTRHICFGDDNAVYVAGDSQVPLLIGTSVQGLSDYHNKFIYQIGDIYEN